jgi:ribosomal protein S12 methylthiotransferase
MRELGKLEGLHWMRILYAYPSYFTEELIDEIATNPKVATVLRVWVVLLLQTSPLLF